MRRCGGGKRKKLLLIHSSCCSTRLKMENKGPFCRLLMNLCTHVLAQVCHDLYHDQYSKIKQHLCFSI